MNIGRHEMSKADSCNTSRCYRTGKYLIKSIPITLLKKKAFIHRDVTCKITRTNWDYETKYILFPVVSQNTDRLKGGFPYQYLWGKQLTEITQMKQEKLKVSMCDFLLQSTHMREWHLMWHLNNRTKPGCTQLIRPAKTCICLLHLYKYNQLISHGVIFFLLTDSSEGWVTCQVCDFPLALEEADVFHKHWCICFSSLMISVSAITYRRKITGDKTTQPYIPYPDHWNAEFSTNK